MATPPHSTDIVQDSNGYYGVFVINGERQTTKYMPNEHNARIALRNIITSYNNMNKAKIALPIPERKPIALKVEGESPSRGSLSGITLRGF